MHVSADRNRRPLWRQLFSLTILFAFVFQHILIVSPFTAEAAIPPTISINAFGSSYTQNFNALALSGTSSATPDGWGFVEAGTNANANYTAGTGSSNGGDTYSFGAASNPERAFGALRSGSVVPTFGAAFTNATGGTITSLAISYTGERGHDGRRRASILSASDGQ